MTTPKKRGRKSAAERQLKADVPALAGSVETMARPDAPYDLTDEEAHVWTAIVDAMPADWFEVATFPMLAQYCRHVVRSNRVAALITEMETPSDRRRKKADIIVEDYDRLLKMQERESRAIASLATKMRISQQSTTNHRGNREKKTVRRPWETD
jgi:hypothetical protein